jgi:6-phosphogluconolactonase (cycloisomerase 2 family)
MWFASAARALLVGSRPGSPEGSLLAGGERYLRAVLFTTTMAGLLVLFLSCGSSNPIKVSTLHNAYVTLPTSGSVLLLHINQATGQISLGPQTPQQLGVSPYGIALAPSQKYLYVANASSNNISSFNIASDGSLSQPNAPIPGGSGPNTAIVDPSGGYLLVTNSFSNDISVFSIDNSSGALSEVPGSPFYANYNPGQIVFAPGPTNYVYVSNSTIGMVSAFSFDPSSGTLTPVSGSPFLSGAGATGLAVYGNAPSQFLYVSNSTAINKNSNTIGNISGFSIDSTGALSVLNGSPFTSVLGSGPSELVLAPSGNLLFAITAGSSYSVWAFTINSVTGQLAASSNSPYSVAGGNLFALIDTRGNYLYIGSQTAKGIEGYTYDPNVGTPNALTNSPFSTVVAPGKMVVVE